MPNQQKIYLLLILYAASVSTMRIPTAYQQGYHSDSDIEESIDNLTSTHPDFVKVATNSIRKHVRSLLTMATYKLAILMHHTPLTLSATSTRERSSQRRSALTGFKTYQNPQSRKNTSLEYCTSPIRIVKSSSMTNRPVYARIRIVLILL